MLVTVFLPALIFERDQDSGKLFFFSKREIENLLFFLVIPFYLPMIHNISG